MITDDEEKWYRKNYFDIPRAPSEIPAGPIQPFLADFFALGSSNSEGARGISKYFFLDHFSSSFLSPKNVLSRVKILVHLF
jgi:hypothetical protein